MILIVGATGFLGGEICRRLAAQGKPIRGLVRPTADPARVENLKQLGVELMQGDLKDRVSLDRACQGATAVITTATMVTDAFRQPDDTIQSVDLEGQISLVDAARAAGVSHFVYTSYSNNFKTDCPLTSAKRAVERHVQQSGMAYTILRPSAFHEVWLGPAVGFDFPNAKAQIYGAGQNKISWIALGDVAQFAIEALENPAARNATLELGGPAALSPLEAVHIFEQVGGRPFELQHVPEEALEAQYAAATDPFQKSFAALMLGVAQGDPIEMDATLQAFPLQLTSVEEYAQRVLVHA
jgi:uncharacterized protein YbjT (DUF2867 family)